MCPNSDEQRPDAWQPTPRLRWKNKRIPSLASYAGRQLTKRVPVLQQLWHIPNSEQRDWRDVPTVREEQG